MKDIKWIFVFYSLAAVLSMCGIGIAVGRSSMLGIAVSMIALTLIMGYGFKTKKKMREQGIL